MGVENDIWENSEFTNKQRKYRFRKEEVERENRDERDDIWVSQRKYYWSTISSF